jgi:hypothetical protein
VSAVNLCYNLFERSKEKILFFIIMTKKILFLIASILAVLALVVISIHPKIVSADKNESEGEGNNQTSSISTENHGSVVSQMARQNEGENKGSNEGENNIQESASLDSNGDFNVTGVKVNSIDASSNSVNVSLYGLSKTVSLAGVSIIGSNQTISVSDIQVGDILSGSGNYNEATHAITISKVIDNSYTTRNVSSIQAQIQHLLDLINQLQAQIQGTSH